MNPADFPKNLQKARELAAAGKFMEALKLYSVLVKLQPLGGGEYGRVAAESGDFELANRIWESVRKHEPNNAELLFRLADEYTKAGLHAKARDLLNEAAKLDSNNAAIQIKLAQLLARTNSVEEARPVVNRCCEIHHDDEQTRFLSAHLCLRESKLEEAERQFREMIASGLKLPQVRYACYSGLASILDRTGRFDEAMAVLEEGKQYARQTFHLKEERKAYYERHEKNVSLAISLPKNILETWCKTFPERARCITPPVSLLTGSSRSGTTLLERVLDAHPAVVACDEALVFQKIQPRIDILASSIPAQRLNGLRDLYVKSMGTVLEAPVQSKTLLDKNPSRTVWLPAFLRLFPELRVVIALRDPRDVMISLYFQDHPNTNYLTFEELAKHYSSVMDVWLAVREWEGLHWLETRYEDIVADLQKEGGRVTKFLSLEWHENQAQFHQRNREKPILSTNYSEVTKPVYSRSVGRWRVYEKQLAPALQLLESYCKKFGYE
jgi:tetratricopeptide (TPR) repeat protein